MSNKTSSILLVDDETMERVFLAYVLRQVGYIACSASGLAEALECSSQLGTIDLLITAVSMADGIGCELAERLQAERPELKILFISHLAGSEAMRYYKEPHPHIHFLQKPFGPEEFLESVSRALTPAEPGPISAISMAALIGG